MLNITYTVITTPTEGLLSLNNIPLQLGGTFTQDDIDNGLVKFTSTSTTPSGDEFIFTVADTEGGWIGTFTFQINVVPVNNDDLLSRSIQLRPNPAQDMVNLVIEDMDLTAGELILYNTKGQIIHRQAVNSNSTQIDLKGLSTGMYMVQFRAADQLWTGKILKQ